MSKKTDHRHVGFHARGGNRREHIAMPVHADINQTQCFQFVMKVLQKNQLSRGAWKGIRALTGLGIKFHIFKETLNTRCSELWRAHFKLPMLYKTGLTPWFHFKLTLVFFSCSECFNPVHIIKQLSTYQAILKYWIEDETYRQRNGITRAFFNIDLPQLRTPVQGPNAYR